MVGRRLIDRLDIRLFDLVVIIGIFDLVVMT
jgi:hypothetical protein